MWNKWVGPKLKSDNTIFGFFLIKYDTSIIESIIDTECNRNRLLII